MTRSITVHPGQSMTDVINGVRIAQGDDLVIEIPADASVLLTANEFRALSIAAERDEVEISVYTEDPLRRQLAMLFGVPLVNEIPQPLPYVVPEPEPEPIDEDPAPEEEFQHDGAPTGFADPVPPPKPRRSAARPLALLFATIAAGMLALFAYWWFFSSATITVNLKREQVSSTIGYSVVDPGVSTDGLQGIVMTGQPVTFDLSLGLSAPATGALIVPDEAATGSLVLRNPASTPVSIDAGAEFEGFDGQTFAFSDGVEVPAAVDSNTPGEVTAEVRAVAAGEAGNTELGMLTGRLPNGVYYSNRTEPLEGGTQKTITIVSQADLDGLAEQINQQLTALAATTQLTGGLLLIPSSIQHGEGAYDFDQAVGAEATEVSVNAVVPFTATAYDPTALSDVAGPILQGEVPPGFVFQEDSVRVNTPAETGRTDGVVSMLATVTGDSVPIVDAAMKDQIAVQLAGKSEPSANAYLGALPFASSSEISYSPTWLPSRIPNSADRIQVEVT